ncbi:hypothetical protein ANN_10361 [Periplaneta americana]|uniref:Uncharacterized protein n=1 Tax=Periplaneta americana TaxID=6978 RepID=A0ABQ8TNS7_PERAM|nr:hypothetical protein ANN_10361 [Periplaneta americana]
MTSGSSTESYPAFAHIWLRENPGKNNNQVTFPDRESNPGRLVFADRSASRYSTGVNSAMNVPGMTHIDIGCHARIPTRNTILRWVASFRITGSTLKKKSPGRNSIALRLSEATVRSRALRLLSLGPFEGGTDDTETFSHRYHQFPEDATESVAESLEYSTTLVRLIARESIIISLALPRALRHLGRAIGMDPVLLGHLGGVNLEQGRVGGPHWALRMSTAGALIQHDDKWASIQDAGRASHGFLQRSQCTRDTALAFDVRDLGSNLRDTEWNL